MSGKYNRKDHFYRKAKSEGLRSRAVFKLKELDQKRGLIKSGFKILDLGAWPGGWLEESVELVGAAGLVVGIDLKAIDDFGIPNIKTLQGDVGDANCLEQAIQIAGSKYDLVLSDMSPKLTGIKEVDRYAAVNCAELALNAAKVALKPGGNLVIKVFKSNETDQFVKNTRPLFNNLMREELKSSRNTSTEYYLVATGFKSA